MGHVRLPLAKQSLLTLSRVLSLGRRPACPVRAPPLLGSLAQPSPAPAAARICQDDPSPSNLSHVAGLRAKLTNRDPCVLCCVGAVSSSLLWIIWITFLRRTNARRAPSAVAKGELCPVVLLCVLHGVRVLLWWSILSFCSESSGPKRILDSICSLVIHYYIHGSVVYIG